MSKIKNEMLGDLTQQELDEIYFNRILDDEQAYQEWLESDEYIDMVNEQLSAIQPIYSEVDIFSALRYASDQITLDPSEVGKDVYDALFIEKVYERLTNQNGL